MLLLLPMLLLVAMLMLVFQGRPVIFSQWRSGKDFVPFRIYKFRTMRGFSEDASGLTHGLHDQRITRLGFFLRKYKIDELPQLLNVLNGEMSLVGSRPQVPFYTEKFQDWYQKILRRKPGLLSYAATRYSNEEELLDQVEHPENYYEQVLVPIKCRMDLEMNQGFGLQTYFKVMLDYAFHFFK